MSTKSSGKSLWSESIAPSVRITRVHITVYNFLVLWVFIYVLCLSWPPKQIMSSNDFMKFSGYTELVGVDGDGTKSLPNARLSDKGRQVLVGWSALFAFVLALVLHFLMAYL